MKHLILVGDGMADYPLSGHDGRTPLELARIPAMDRVVRLGLTGLFWPIPDDLPPGSDVGNLSLFGYDPHVTFTGRAPLEAANQGIVLGPGQVAFRCNLVTLRDGLMEDFTAGHISSEEAAKLIETLNETVGASFGVTFHPGVSYRHLTIVTPSDVRMEGFQFLACTPPHDITGQPYVPHLPQGSGADFIRELMCASQPVLKSHAVNEARLSQGRPAATSIWLWGQGRAPSMEPYPKRFGLHGAVVSAVDLVNGIGVCAGFEVLKVPGATGYLDTNYAGKVQAALDALDRVDVVYIHIEAPDETAHQGRLDLKIEAIEAFDANVVAPCLDAILNRGDARLVVTPDHVTALSTRTHASGPVPFALCGAGIVPDGAEAYSERVAAGTDVALTDGYRLVPLLLTSKTVSAATLKD